MPRNFGHLEMEGSVIGRIIFSNGVCTQALVTKRQAIEIGKAIALMIDDIDWFAIEKEILMSQLPFENEVLETFNNTVQCEQSDMIKREIAEETNAEEQQGTDDWEKEGEGWKDD